MSPGQNVAQGFTVGVAGTLDEIDIGLYRTTGATGTVTLSLLNFVNGAPDTNLSNALYSQTIDASQIPQKASTDTTPITSLVAFNLLAAGIHVTKGEQLAIAMNGTGAGTPPWIILATGMPSYAGGLEYTRYGAAVTWSPSPNATNSLAFNTFVQTAASAVPEPSSVVLLGVAGLTGLGYARCRRMATAI